MLGFGLNGVWIITFMQTLTITMPLIQRLYFVDLQTVA